MNCFEFERGGNYILVVPQKSTDIDRYAAEELKKYLSAALNINADIVEEEPTIKNGIFIGKTKQTMEAYSDEYYRLNQDEFIIKSCKNALFIFGKNNIYSQSATLYGIYELLERFFGCKFLSFDEEIIPESDKVCITEDLIGRPDFIIRQPLFASTRVHPEFTAKMRIKDCYCPKTPGGTIYPMWAGPQGHNFFSLIPPDKYKDEHSEWFDLDNHELCFSQEDLTDEIVEILKKQIIENPYAKFFAVSQNDTVKPCQCARCQENYQKYSVSGTMMRFINRIAEKIDAFVQENYIGREVYIVTFAYYFSIKPPVKKIADEFQPIDQSCVPHKNVFIFFTTIDFCFYHGLTDERCEWNKEFKDIFYGWKYLVGGNRMMVWNYAANYAHYLYPFYNFNEISNNLRFFKENGIKYLLDHGPCEAEFVEFAELRTYVTSKLLWNTNLNIDQLIQEFVENYYKVASSEVLEYLQLLKNRFAEIDGEKGYHLRLYHLPESMFDKENFPIEFLNKLFDCFSRGFGKIDTLKNEQERDTLKKRLTRIRVSTKYLLLMNYEKYGIGGKEQFETEFLEDCNFCGITHFKEDYHVKIPNLIELSKKNEVLKY